MFEDFDFGLLDDAEFKEDSVREELIAPLLKHLGYSAGGPHKIIRSKPLTHPFVRIGTIKREIKIIPDYLLEVDKDNRWILDAKGPGELITSGKNVEQAFSYAIHPDVRAFIYVLCNGRELAVFSICKVDPILVVKLNQIDAELQEIKLLLSPLAFIDPDRLLYKPDFGLYMKKLGARDGFINHFVPISIPFIAKVEDDLYSIVTAVEFGDIALCMSLDFDEAKYQLLLSVMDQTLANEVQYSLSRQPYHIILGERSPELVIAAVLTGKVHTNNEEDYCPLLVTEFKPF